jgi:hypothetical protein
LPPKQLAQAQVTLLNKALSGLICYFIVGSVVGRKYINILYCFKTNT